MIGCVRGSRERVIGELIYSAKHDALLRFLM